MKKAFTLAEVLAALAIVGVIASVSIPTLQAGYQDRKYKSLAKKAHSTLQQAIESTIMDDNIRSVRDDMGIIYWLASMNIGGFVKDEPSLRTIDEEIGVSTASVKLTDGMIIQDLNECNSCNDNNVCIIAVDVDGASGPTISVLDDPIALDGAADIMLFHCRNNNIMPPLRDAALGGQSAAAQRTRAHLGIED